MKTLFTVLFYIAIVLLGYTLGSIPFGIIISKLYGVDIRNYGSHNTGGTNVGRTLGKKAGILTMTLDGLKCYLSMLIVLLVISFTPIRDNIFVFRYFNEFAICLTGISVLIGHTLPVFAHFKGGKAVASFAGFMFFISPILFVIGCSIFFTLFKFSKRISFCSIITVPCIFILSLIPMILDLTVLKEITDFNGGLYFTPSFMLHLSFVSTISIFLACLLIVLRHLSNINRLRKGIEPETHFKNIVKENDNVQE